MNSNYYIIVGDDYVHFSDQNSIYTVSDFYRKMLEDAKWPESSANMILGQGISYHDREFIDHATKRRNAERLFPLPAIASLDDTHKRTDENVLISQPLKLGKLRYGFDLTITDKSDRLSDHVTGKHVGAMLLMEAARQATIAVLEREYCRKSSEKFGLILDRFDCQFDGYLFPLPTSLDTTIEELKVSPKNITVVVKTVVSQADCQIAAIGLDVTLCASQVLDKIESRKAQTVVKRLCQSLEESQEQQLDIA